MAVNTSLLKKLFSKPTRYHPVVPERPVDLAAMDRFRVEDFPPLGPTPWLDRPDAKASIASLLSKGQLSALQAEQCQQWEKEGYLILPGFFQTDVLDQAWEDYEAAIAEGRLEAKPDHGQDLVDDQFPGRVLNPHFEVPAMRRLWKSPEMVDIVSMLLGVKAMPFQTIAGHKGSEQLAHSDSIHMTTYPQGYLAANWIAFEDINPDSGPLEFYPGSHKLPYTYSADVGIALRQARNSYVPYHALYEPHIQKLIEDHGLERRHFHANKGDVLLWHANLLHGGSPRKNAALSRRALVCHYFAEGCVCFHDYTGTLSHLHPRTQAKAPEAMLSENEFNGLAYLEANPDVKAAGVDPYQHYREYGFMEGRSLGMPAQKD